MTADRDPAVHTGFAAFRLLLLVAVTVTLAVGVAWAFTRVGKLHMRALHAERQAEARALLNEAQTVGALGWVAFLAACAGFGCVLLDALDPGSRRVARRPMGGPGR